MSDAFGNLSGWGKIILFLIPMIRVSITPLKGSIKRMLPLSFSKTLPTVIRSSESL